MRKGKFAQASVEYLSTYAWAFVAISILMASLYFFFALPPSAVPARCTFIYGITCVGVQVGTNTVASAVDLYLANGQQYDLVGNTVATVVMGQYGTANAICIPANIPAGGITICNVLLPNKIGLNKVGQQVGATVYLNTSVCLSGPISNCQQRQPVAYTGNFTTQIGGNAKPILPTIGSPYMLAANYPHNTQTKIIVNVKVFGAGARGAAVYFTTTGSAQINPPLVLTDTTGNATAYIRDPSAQTVTVTATFGSVSSSNAMITFT